MKNPSWQSMCHSQFEEADYLLHEGNRPTGQCNFASKISNIFKDNVSP